MRNSTPAPPLLHREVVESVLTPHGELTLRQVRDDNDKSEHELMFNGVFLMATYCGGSSAALMEHALTALPADADGLRVLIGGLGMGFTLDRALCEPSVSHVTVVEIEPTVVRWNRQYLGNARLLLDSRVRIVNADFTEFLAEGAERYDIIASDIDNGPSWLARPENARLYEADGLTALVRCLAPDGVAAFWCHQRNTDFENRLRRFFHTVQAYPCVDMLLTAKPLKSWVLLAAAKQVG